MEQNGGGSFARLGESVRCEIEERLPVFALVSNFVRSVWKRNSWKRRYEGKGKGKSEQDASSFAPSPFSFIQHILAMTWLPESLPALYSLDDCNRV